MDTAKAELLATLGEIKSSKSYKLVRNKLVDLKREREILVQ